VWVCRGPGRGHDGDVQHFVPAGTNLGRIQRLVSIWRLLELATTDLVTNRLRTLGGGYIVNLLIISHVVPPRESHILMYKTTIFHGFLHLPTTLLLIGTSRSERN